MRVAVVAEFYPRHEDPVLGVWAHRQAIAARDAGAEVTVFVLHRLVPPAPRLRAAAALARQPRRELLDGLEVHYVRYVSPPRGRAYARWGRWAAPALGRALCAGRTVRCGARTQRRPGRGRGAAHRDRAPLVTSVHGGDVLWTNSRVPGGRAAVERVLRSRPRSCWPTARASSVSPVRARCAVARVVHLGTDFRRAGQKARDSQLIVTVGHLVARKRHADVLEALAELPGVRYLVIGDGPERGALERRAAALGSPIASSSPVSCPPVRRCDGYARHRAS